MSVRARIGLLMVLLLALLGVGWWLAADGDPLPDETSRHAVVGVHAVWLEGADLSTRDDVDAFFDCLIHHSSLNAFWSGDVGLVYRGSHVIAPPTEPVAYTETASWLATAFERGSLSTHKRDDHSVYVVFANGADVRLKSACGRTQTMTVKGQTVAVAFVRNYPLCWPTRDRLRTETQVGMHELAEAVELLLGREPCVGDGACEGRRACSENACDNFVGLHCPGAPEKSWTGCRGGQVRGWVIQTLASAGRTRQNCETCMECDFTPTVCPPDTPECAAEAVRSDGLPVDAPLRGGP